MKENVVSDQITYNFVRRTENYLSHSDPLLA
jgi:hypothetical protein